MHRFRAIAPLLAVTAALSLAHAAGESFHFVEESSRLGPDLSPGFGPYFGPNFGLALGRRFVRFRRGVRPPGSISRRDKHVGAPYGAATPSRFRVCAFVLL